MILFTIVLIPPSFKNHFMIYFTVFYNQTPFKLRVLLKDKEKWCPFWDRSGSAHYFHSCSSKTIVFHYQTSISIHSLYFFFILHENTTHFIHFRALEWQQPDFLTRTGPGLSGLAREVLVWYLCTNTWLVTFINFFPGVNLLIAPLGQNTLWWGGGFHPLGGHEPVQIHS